MLIVAAQDGSFSVGVEDLFLLIGKVMVGVIGLRVLHL